MIEVEPTITEATGEEIVQVAPSVQTTPLTVVKGFAIKGLVIGFPFHVPPVIVPILNPPVAVPKLAT